MTILVGILCDSGIVVGGDGSVTLGTTNAFTVCQNNCKKLYLIEGKIILGSSGHHGLGQRLRYVTEQLWKERKFLNTNGGGYIPPEEAMTVLRQKLWEVTAPEFGAAQMAVPVIGPQAASQTACNYTIVALPLGQNPCLFSFNQQCSPEMATPAVPFVSVGSGQPIADPFLAFLRRMFWHDHLPSLADGVFATVWTLDQTIESAPGFVAHPIQIVVMEKSNQQYMVRELDEKELREHRGNIERAENCLSNFKKLAQATEGQDLIEVEQ